MARPKLRDLPDLTDLAVPGTEIPVRVTARAARNAVQNGPDAIRISVTEVAENGKANAAVRALLARAMGVTPSRLTQVRGHTSRNKAFVYS